MGGGGSTRSEQVRNRDPYTPEMLAMDAALYNQFMLIDLFFHYLAAEETRERLRVPNCTYLHFFKPILGLAQLKHSVGFLFPIFTIASRLVYRQHLAVRRKAPRHKAVTWVEKELFKIKKVSVSTHLVCI